MKRVTYRSQHIRMNKLLGSATIAAVAVIWFALGAVVAPASAIAAEKTIVIGIEADVNRLDPHASTSWNTFRELLHMFEGFVAEDLTRSDVGTPPIVPALAESWEITDGGTVYTFKLRQGVKFHDGTPWNAEAAKFNLNRMTNPNFEYHQPIAVGLMRWLWQDLESYEVVDEYTFRLKLTQPNSEFLRRLTAGGSGTPRMISPASVKKFGNDGVEQHPVGTGPFKFEERVIGEKLSLIRNPDYWDPSRLPKYDRLIIRGIPEVSTRELALISGEVDIIATPSPDSIEYLKARGLKVITGPVSTIYMLWVNFKDPILQDVRVRRAICMAIDREGMSKYHRRGFAQPARGILNYGGPGYDPNFRDCEYDPDKARKLLAEAGYPDGFTTRLDWTLPGGGDVNTKGDAEWLQRDLAKIGVAAEIQMFDGGTYWDMLASGIRKDTGFMSVSWGETSFFWLDQVIATGAIPPGGFNSGYYENLEIDALLAKARVAETEEEMVGHLREVQRIVAEDMAFIPYYTPIAAYAMQPNVSGFTLAPQHWQDFTQLTKN